jgi:hypothetical protein
MIFIIFHHNESQITDVKQITPITPALYEAVVCNPDYALEIIWCF